jgi:hypothetical protein
MTSADDPHKYKGSGKHWKRHIRIHGYKVDTEIYFQSENVDEAAQIAIKFSKENNIVESKEWANMIEENCIIGWSKGVVFSEEHKQNLRKPKSISYPKSEEHKRKIGKAQKGVPRPYVTILKKGVPRPTHVKEAMISWRIRIWIVTDPIDNKQEIINLKKFCREHELDSAAMQRVANGTVKQHKGWRCERTEE